MSNEIRILLVEDEDYDVRRVRNTLRPVENRIRIKDVVASGTAAIELLEKNRFGYDVVIMDFQIAGGLMGERLIKKMKEIDPLLQIIVITKMTVNITDFEFANKLLEAGAMWYCTKYPGDIEDFIYQPTDFILNIFNAFEKKRLEKDRLRSNKKLDRNVREILESREIIGESEPIQRLRRQIVQIAATDSNVLIRGNSGTGKELVATHIHYLSRRKYEKFMPINCGSIPGDLIESELFGFERGSFTGANTKKAGLFEVADKGTVFLDEIAELSPTAQVKLLRVIQEGEIDKIGRTDKIKVNVRIIAATNKILEEEVKEKRFREDLYYRLNVVSVIVPPLNQRKNDIPLLTRYFLQKFSQDMNMETPQVEAAAMDLLAAHSWPGNIRELQNIIQRLLFIGEKIIKAVHVNAAFSGTPVSLHASPAPAPDFGNNGEIVPWRDAERRYKKEYFQYVRENTASDAEAARQLGLAPPNYYRMCKELGLK
ncbi:MAG: sigma-54 dependent transcriptional regulator [Calditrichia bacterium]